MRKAQAGPPPVAGAPVQLRKNICTHCSVGCTVTAEVQNGVWIGQEPGFDSPFNLGAHCAKGAAAREHAHGDRRLKYPMKLVAGKWTEEEKTLMARAYFEKLSPECNPFSSAKDFFRALDFCRLQIAVQWLGWFGRRRAYSAHTHDWLSEAVSLAERLMS